MVNGLQQIDVLDIIGYRTLAKNRVEKDKNQLLQENVLDVKGCRTLK